jgi:hypothetical protein
MLNEHDLESKRGKITGVSAPLSLGGVTWETSETYPTELGLRNQIERLTDILAVNQTGLLITLDEIHRQQIDELRQLATSIQHTFREEREVAFVGAGLTAAVSDVVNDHVLTFLRRAERHSLGSVSGSDVARAIKEPIESSDRTVDDDALKSMVDGTRGYPFLIQLVGAQVWKLNPESPIISSADAERGVTNAHQRLGSLVHQPALANASDIDKSFLLAMAKDDGPSKMADIQQRLDVNANYASQYRIRLIDSELIDSPARGYVDFALPFLREYLREHAVSDV